MTPDRIDLRRPASVMRQVDVDPVEIAVREHCELLFRSPQFDASERSRKFLRFVIDESLSGRGESLDQASIATAVFGRDRTFDAVLDPIVRVQAGRLRRSLERYYLLTADGAHALRIELPKGSYAPAFVRNERASPVRQSNAGSFAESWPSVVVQPFETSSNRDAEAGEQLKDALTMELARYGTVGVVRQRDLERLAVAHRAAPRFELSGSLRHFGVDAIVRIRLVDRASGIQLWSDEYHTHAPFGYPASSIEEIGRVIAARVGDEHGVILRQLASEHARQNPEAPGLHSAILRSHHFLFSRQVSDLAPAIKALQQVTVSEAENPLGWLQLARLRLANYAFELTSLSTPIEETIGYAYQGVLLDPVGTRASCVLATALLVKGDLRSARDELEQTLRHNRDSLVYRETIGWLMALTGDWTQGMALVRDAARRNPCCIPYVKQALWMDHLRAGEFENAYIAALEYRDPSGFWPLLMSACCLGHLGLASEAQASVTALLAAKPEFAERGRTLVGYFIKAGDLRATIFDGLDRAGLRLA